MAFIVGAGLLVWTSIHTVQSHAYILTTINGPSYMLFLIVTCKTTHKLEKVGTLLVALGVILMIIDPKAIK